MGCFQHAVTVGPWPAELRAHPSANRIMQQSGEQFVLEQVLVYA
jgi:hypothetical protein